MPLPLEFVFGGGGGKDEENRTKKSKRVTPHVRRPDDKTGATRERHIAATGWTVSVKRRPPLHKTSGVPALAGGEILFFAPDRNPGM